MDRQYHSIVQLVFVCLVIAGCAHLQGGAPLVASEPFSIAVIPDTQNYVDYKRQPAEGFAIDSSSLFIEQMHDIASRSAARGGEVVFVASVGDVWQHQTELIDADHRMRGFERIANPLLELEMEVTDQTRTVEMPKAIEGYRILAKAGLPFGVAPGNHDYDAMWSAEGFPPNLTKGMRELTMIPEDLGMLHIGGLDNFRSAFGTNSEFFENQSWYVDSFAGGADSAQKFTAGGYRFLHIALEMQAPDAALDWAASVISANPGLPTIVTTHDYLDHRGERRANPIVDLDRVDPDHHNSAEELWSKLISQHDQIFLVLCGHHHGQSLRVDKNASGNPVYQVLADYQDRGQAGLDAGQALNRYTGKPIGIGDGWYRLMRFDLGAVPPRIEVSTYSSYYKVLSRDLDAYAGWYKQRENPRVTDEDFHATDDYEIILPEFIDRFGLPRYRD